MYQRPEWLYENTKRMLLPYPKSPKKNVHILSETEILYLLESAKTSVPWITSRNRSIIALMLDSGLRQKEICTLTKKSIDFSRNVLKVTGKGAKDRFVSLGLISRSFLEDYLNQCPYLNVEYVFCGRSGCQITRNSIKVFMNRLKRDTGLDLSSHKLRHNFATNFCIDHLQKTGSSSVYDLSILMGHESLETTKKYEHFAHELIATEATLSHLDKVYQV